MKIRLAVGAVIGAAVLGTAAFSQGTQQPDPEAAEASAASSSSSTNPHPIGYVHDVHAGQYQMDCQYCHFSAERSVDAGMPPVETCMGCHRIIAGSTETARTEIAKIAEHYNEGRAIEWVRIYKVSDHVHFPHMRHVNAGVTCQTCHGQVQEKGAIVEVEQDLSMGWCVSCHRDPEYNARVECSVCHY